MTTPDATQQAIRLALDSSSADDIITGVKEAVADEIVRLSPGAVIEMTAYFNHTYVPDMILKWGQGKHSDVRPIYLRDRLDPGPTKGDVENLRHRSPVFLGFAERTENFRMSTVRESANQTARVLVTDVEAIGRLVEVPGHGAAISTQDNPSPIIGLVRNNILRAGRGLMTPLDAAQIADAADLAARPMEDGDNQRTSRLDSLQQAAEDVFADDGVFQLMRTATLLQSAISPDQPTRFLEYATGSLTESELRVMLPYLLKLEGPIEDNVEFWQQLSRLVGLGDLLALPEMDGLDISHLVTNEALSRWKANRAELVLNNDDEFESGNTVWRISNGLLGATVGPWRIMLTPNDNRKLRGRDDSLPADWSDLEPVARRFAIDSASLRGITRRFQVGVEQSTDIAGDVSRIVSTLPDSYRVNTIEVRIPGDDSTKSIEIDYKRMLASVKGNQTSVSSLATAALLLLGYRYPTEAEWLRL